MGNFLTKISRLLPKILAEITGHNRYLPEFEWSKNSWAFNLFRIYEQIFWRRIGIRPESASSIYCKDGKFIVTHQFFTVESFMVFTEYCVRTFFKDFRIPIKIWIPQISAVGGLPQPASPFLFAIAFDATGTRTFINSVTTADWTHVCSGTGRLFVANSQASAAQGSTNVTGVTYNSVSTTKLEQMLNNDYIAFWYLPNAASGTNTATINATSSTYFICCSSSYSGVATSSPIESNGSNSTSGTTANAVTLTSNTATNWLVSLYQQYGSGSVVNATGGTQRVMVEGNGSIIFDSNGTVGTGSVSISLAPGASTISSVHMMALIKIDVTTYAKTVTAKARLKVVDIAKTVTAKARIKLSGVVKTVTAKARVNQLGVIKTITAKAAIQGAGAKTITAKARIKNTVIQTVTAKGRVLIPNNAKTVTAKGQIKQAGVAKTTTSKARMKVGGVAKTLTAKGQIAGSLAKTVTAKASITNAVPKTVTARSRIKTAGVAKTVTAKAKIRAQRRGFILMKNKDQTFKQSMSDNRIR